MISDLQVLLIGGPPGAGKTTLGRALAAQLGFGSLTADDLVITGRVLTTPESHPALHQMRSIGHTRYFTETPGAQLIADAKALEETMWPALDRVIASHVMAKTPTVIDWWLFSPQRIATIDEGGITSIWLHVDPEVLEDRERQLNAEFWGESSDPEQMLGHFMERSLWRNDLVFTQAKERGMPVLDQTGLETVDDLVASALGIVTERRDPQ